MIELPWLMLVYVFLMGVIADQLWGEQTKKRLRRSQQPATIGVGYGEPGDEK